MGKDVGTIVQIRMTPAPLPVGLEPAGRMCVLTEVIHLNNHRKERKSLVAINGDVGCRIQTVLNVK